MDCLGAEWAQPEGNNSRIPEIVMCSKLHIDLSLAFQLKPQHVGTVAMEFHKFLFPETDTVPPGRRGHLFGLRRNIFITGSPRNELNLSPLEASRHIHTTPHTTPLLGI